MKNRIAKLLRRWAQKLAPEHPHELSGYLFLRDDKKYGPEILRCQVKLSEYDIMHLHPTIVRRREIELKKQMLTELTRHLEKYVEFEKVEGHYGEIELNAQLILCEPK